MNRTRNWQHWLDRLGKGMALTGAAGLVVMAASLSATTVLAWSSSDYSLSTTSFTSSGASGSPSTQASPGQYIYDTATLTSTYPSASPYVERGTVEFYLYQGSVPASCTGFSLSGAGALTSYLVPVAGTSSQSGSGANVEQLSSLNTAQPNSGYQIPSTATSGSGYYWVAVYSDGVENLQQISPCSSEPVTVRVPLPSLGVTTYALPSSIVLGGSVGDSALVSGYQTLLQDDSAASGSVVFSLFQGDSCTGTPVYTSSSIPLSGWGNAATPSGAFKPAAAGPFEWQATVSIATGSGWPLIAPFSSTCSSELLSVQAQTGLTTTTSADPAEEGAAVQFGAEVSDSATVTGGYSPTGSVIFNLFNSSSCSQGSLVYTSDPVALSGGQAQSGSFVVNRAGTWEWTATYSGDQYNTTSSSACGAEPVVVGQATPSVTTVTSTHGITAVPAGTEIGDTADVTNSTNGTANSATGDVNFNLFDPTERSCAGEPVFSNEQVLELGQPYSTATSDGYVVDELGHYSWTAEYLGDSNDISANSACGSELVDVVQATPSISTTTASTALEGSSITDEAEITGGYHAYRDATVTFGLYSNWSCTDLVGQTSTQSIDSNGDAFSAPVLVSRPGRYFWEDTYSGNTLNQSVTSRCTSEPVWVTKYSPTLATVQVTPVTTGQTTVVSDIATLSNFYPNPASSSADSDGSNWAGSNGTVKFKLFGPVTGDAPVCQCGEGGNLVEFGSATVTEVSGQYQASFTGTIDTALLPGNYYWEAQYSGDAYDTPASAGCGELTVVQPNTPTVTTTPSSGGVIGTTLTDTAAVTPVVTPAANDDAAVTASTVTNGTADSVHFELFLNDPTCSVASDLVDDFGSFYVPPTTNSDGSLTYTVSVPTSGYKSVADGTYYWDVTFAGDAYNNTASECGEPVSISTPTAGGVLGASTSTPNTGADLFGPGLAGALAMLFGGLLLVVGRRVLRLRTR
ncbi:MAG: hypothetical protein ABSF27_04560 [Candidatus Dormibacteria bacterium]